MENTCHDEEGSFDRQDTKYLYSSASVNTAGRIIEVVVGIPYEEFLGQRLFKPLGMKDTTFWPNEELKRLAKSYKPTKDEKGPEATPIGQLRHPLDARSRTAILMIGRGGRSAGGEAACAPTVVATPASP